MALPAAAVFQIQSTAAASNVNSGGFNPANANMLTDGAATLATGNSPVFSSASYNFVAGDVGHWLYIKSGTNWTPGWYQIASVAANAATLSAAIGSGIQVSATTGNYGTQTVAGVATTASPTAATWSIDYSQSDAAPFAPTDLVLATTTTLTSAGVPFGKNMVGNLIHITGGTGFTVGWYEIVSVSGTTATIDRVGGTLSSTGGTGNTGGALSLGSSDDAIFELAVSSSTVSPIFFIKGGSSVTYTIGGAVSVSATGDPRFPIIYQGYASKRGDNPTDATRPTLAFAANGFVMGANTLIKNTIVTGTNTTIVNCNGIGGNNFYDCLFINPSTTATRICVSFTNSTTLNSMNSCELISYRGTGLSLGMTGASALVNGCSIHHCVTGINLSVNFPCNIINTICYSNVTSAMSLNPGTSAGVGVTVSNCTLYGAENKQGTGVDVSGGNTPQIFIRNTIIYGFATGINAGTLLATRNSNYCDFFNNTADVSNWYKGANDIAVNPSFTNMVQRTGSSATTTAGNHLVQSGATFQTWAITPGVDYLHIKSGTGVTAGIYGILSVDSETQITTDVTLAADATANKVWQITQGNNLLPTGAV